MAHQRRGGRLAYQGIAAAGGRQHVGSAIGDERSLLPATATAVIPISVSVTPVALSVARQLTTFTVRLSPV